MTVGWFEIKPHSCEVLVTGLVKGKVLYHYAESGKAHPGHVEWWWPLSPSDQTFCVGQQQTEPFVIFKKDVKENCQASGYGERRLAKVTDDGTGGLFYRYFPLEWRVRKGNGSQGLFLGMQRMCEGMVVVPRVSS